MANSSNPVGGTATQSRVVPAGSTRFGRQVKLVLWVVMGLMTLSVIVFSELPLLRAGSEARAHLLEI